MKSEGSVEVVDELIFAAIVEGAKAGVFRRAQRLNRSAPIWGQLAEQHSRCAATLLGDAMQRRGASDVAS